MSNIARGLRGWNRLLLFCTITSCFVQVQLGSGFGSCACTKRHLSLSACCMPQSRFGLFDVRGRGVSPLPPWAVRAAAVLLLSSKRSKSKRTESPPLRLSLWFDRLCNPQRKNLGMEMPFLQRPRSSGSVRLKEGSAPPLSCVCCCCSAVKRGRPGAPLGFGSLGQMCPNLVKHKRPNETRKPPFLPPSGVTESSREHHVHMP